MFNFALAVAFVLINQNLGNRKVLSNMCGITVDSFQNFDDVQLYHAAKLGNVTSSFTDAFFDAASTFGITQTIEVYCDKGLDDEQHRDCICEYTVGALERHKKGSIIILFVEETLGRLNQHVCNYTAYNKSPIFLQVFAGGIEVNEFALISIASPAGHASFQIRKNHFKKMFPTVLDIVGQIYTLDLVHYNTVRKNDEVNSDDIKAAYQEVQAKVEKKGTPVACVHLAMGVIIMFLTVFVGYLTTDQSDVIQFEVTEIRT